MFRRLLRLMVAVVTVGMFAPHCLAQTNEQYIPLPVYKTGPVSAVGTGMYGGVIDYFDYVNKKYGGVNGVKLVWEECETAFQVDRAVECYERLKRKGSTGALHFMTYQTGAIYALTDRARADKIPLVLFNSGRADASDGRVFPYSFPIGTNYLSANTAKIRFIGAQEGGWDKLKGKKFVNLYIGNAYGKETIPLLEIQAKRYGFEVTHIEVPIPGTEQQAQWLQIRRIQPDWVILRLAGVQVPAALKMAQRMGFPASKMLGVASAGSEEDVIPAGDAAIGFTAWALGPSGRHFPVVKEMYDLLYTGGKHGNMEDPNRVGSVYYNAGVINGILTVEAMRIGQAKFGKRPLTGEEIQWAYERLKLDDKRLKALGAENLLAPVRLSCADHEGGSPARFHRWDGKKWNPVGDWVPTDRALVRQWVEGSAAKYAKDKGITPRDCAKEGA